MIRVHLSLPKGVEIYEEVVSANAQHDEEDKSIQRIIVFNLQAVKP
jgi:hypothetical protein